MSPLPCRRFSHSIGRASTKPVRSEEYSVLRGTARNSPIGWLLRGRACVRHCSKLRLRFEGMSAALIALMVFVMVAAASFAIASFIDQRNAQARLIKERLANERKSPERAPEEELALLRDE